MTEDVNFNVYGYFFKAFFKTSKHWKKRVTLIYLAWGTYFGVTIRALLLLK